MNQCHYWLGIKAERKLRHCETHMHEKEIKVPLFSLTCINSINLAAFMEFSGNWLSGQTMVVCLIIYT